MSEFKIGSRVRLTGHHPWAGQEGWIVGRFGKYGLDWVIELPDQGGHHCGAPESQMERYGAARKPSIISVPSTEDSEGGGQS